MECIWNASGALERYTGARGFEYYMEAYGFSPGARCGCESKGRMPGVLVRVDEGTVDTKGLRDHPEIDNAKEEVQNAPH